jgi:broad specificity phosphatase PhoE
LFPAKKGLAVLNKPEIQKIFLVRHAKPELPYSGRLYYGHTDYPLSKEGIERAKILSKDLDGITFDHIFSSNLLRARHTAELIMPGRASDIKLINAFCEINLGDWEGKTFDEVRETWNELYEARGNSFESVAPPNGESFKDLQKRTVTAFEDILCKYTSGNILIVSHGGVMWTLICHYFSLDLNDIFYYPTDFCGVHVLDRFNGMMKLLRYNWSSKLIW